MRILLVLTIALITNTVFGFEVKQVLIGVNGLTCSQCTRSTEISIRKLRFVKDVQMNLEQTSGVITFKDGADVDLKSIAKAVVKAGFSVREMKVVLDMGGAQGDDKSCVKTPIGTFHLVNGAGKQLSGEQTFKLLGNDYLSRKEAKKWKGKLTGGCPGAERSTYYVSI